MDEAWADILDLALTLRFRYLGVLLLFCLLGLTQQAVRAQTGVEPVSPGEYWALVKESRQEIGALKDKPAAEIHTRLLALALRWEETRVIRLGDGSLLNINNSWWVSQFRNEKPDLQQLETSLDSLLDAKNKSEGAPVNADTSALREILARPEFQWQQQEAPGWLQELWDRLMNWLSGLFGKNLTISTPSNTVIQVLGALGVVFVLLVLGYVLRGLISDLTTDSFLNPENGASDTPLNALAALARADELSNQGDYRSAVRYLYLSALLILDERGLLFYDRTRTNREYLRDLASRPQIAGLLRAVIDVFDRVWYGFQPVDADTYRRYTEQVNELKEQK